MPVNHSVPQDIASLERKVASLHFFKDIAHSDPEQFQALMGQSRLYALAPGETFLRRGEQDTWLYFLMRGELQVCDPADHSRVVGKLISGEVFGEISVITGEPRTMDIVVPDYVREVVVFATNFASLDRPGNGDGMKILTRLMIYRQIVQILRWRIELYRITFPDSELARVPFRLIPTATAGEVGDELQAQREYALFLAVRLQELNATLGPVHSAGSDSLG